MSVIVRFEPAGREVRVPRGTTLLDAARGAGLPLANGCGAEGICARCGVEVLEGEAAFGPEGDEERRIKRRNRIDPRQRLACRAVVSADARVRAPYW